jgi:uncharacterized membrane protein (TIGR02234 family)
VLTGRSRREYAAALALGAAGALLVLLSVRQGWARVVTRPPQPLPATSVRVSGQDLVPLAGALGVAALAGLAAVIATRGFARRLTGLLLALFGAVVVAAVTRPLTASGVAAAAHMAGGPVTGSATAGGAPAGGAPAGAGPALTGHVTMLGFPWRPLTVVGALAVAAAGLAVAWRGGRWPVMSARYDRPGTGRGAGQPPAGGPVAGSDVPGGAAPGGAAPDGGGTDDRRPDGMAPEGPGPDSAALWEALSAGRDPTDPG